MKWSELPKEYQQLEKSFNKDITKFIDSDNLWLKFLFQFTPQGFYFWNECHKAKNISELPPIPNN